MYPPSANRRKPYIDAANNHVHNLIGSSKQNMHLVWSAIAKSWAFRSSLCRPRLELLTYCIQVTNLFLWLSLEYSFLNGLWLMKRWHILAIILQKFTFEQIWATLSKFGIWYWYFVDVFGVVALTFNRLTAIVYPMRYKNVRFASTLGLTWSHLSIISWIP